MSNKYVSKKFRSGAEFESFLTDIETFKEGVIKGTTAVGKAKSATSATSAGSATSATSATKATNDGSGNNIESTYAKKNDLTNGNITVKKATNDGSGNNIESTYAKTSDLTNGSTVVKTAECSNAIKGHSFSAVEINTTDKGYYVGDFSYNTALLIFTFFNLTHGYATTLDFYIKAEFGSSEKRIYVWFESTPAVFRYWVRNGQLYIKAISGVSQANLQVSYIPVNI